MQDGFYYHGTGAVIRIPFGKEIRKNDKVKLRENVDIWEELRVLTITTSL